MELEKTAIARRFAALSSEKQAKFLEALRLQRIDFAQLPIVPQADAQRGVLSYAQQRQWFLWRLDPQSSAYHISGAQRLLGPLDTQALQAAFQMLWRRHAALRTVFESLPDGQARQRVRDDLAFKVDVVDLDNTAGEGSDVTLTQALQAFRQQPFDLEQGPLLRVRLWRVTPQEHVVALVVHHSVADGWSMQVLLDEFAAAYAALFAGKEPSLPELGIDLQDHALWQRHWMDAGESARQLAYWRAHLGDDDVALALPTDTPRDPAHTDDAARHVLNVDPTLAAALRTRAAAAGTTLFTVMLAAYQTLLHRISCADDIRIGVPLANRARPETQHLLGFLAGTQVLRGRPRGSISLNQLLQEAKEAVHGAQAHPDLPFEQLVDSLAPQRKAGQSPLFQAMLNHTREQGDAALVLPGLRSLDVSLGRQTAQFDLTLNSNESPDGRLDVTLIYASPLFSPATIARWAADLLHILQAVAHAPERLIAEVAPLPEEVRQSLLSQGDGGAARRVLSVPERLAAQAAATPDAPALAMGDSKLTYAELDARTNQLAHALRAAGSGAETRVGVLMTRSVEMVVALLGVMKAGAAYVPIDPELPADRLSYLFEDSQASLLLTQSTWLETLPAGAPPALALDRIDLSAHPCTPVGHVPHPEQAAYVIYTSGSTGKPKGAINRHDALAQRLDWMQQTYPIGGADTVLQKTPFGFDVSVWEFFWPLMVGAQLAVAEPGEHRDPQALAARIAAHGVTTLHFVPSMLSAFLAGGVVQAQVPTLRRIVCSGEALPGELRDRCLAALPGVALNNLYGPTEAAIDVTFHDCAPGETGPVPIGAPIAGTQVHVLDADLNLAPPGVAGELYLGGAGLARGYLSRPGMTAERFVANPFGAGRLYRTGDRVRWTESGELDYLGRLDFQVKIRGLRIELGEIESRLLAQAGVREAVVVAANGPGGGQRLVAYVAPQVDSAVLRTALARELPEYMVPSQIIPLETLPLSANGKIDRKALPAPVFDDQAYATPPQGPLETAIAGIWADVLGCTSVGREANFFELGGDSILSLQIVARLRQQGWAVNPRDIFEYQTVARLASVAQPLLAQAETISTPAAGQIQLLPIQAEFFRQAMPVRDHWNQAVLLTPSEPLDESALRAALAQLVNHHDSLRLRFDEGSQGWTQRYAEDAAPSDLLWTAQAADAEALTRQCDAAQRSLKLSHGPLLRALAVHMADGSDRLLLVAHHLVVDGVSWRILLEDLQATYQAARQGRQAALPAKTAHYGEWTRYVAGLPERMDAAEREYWQDTFRDHPATTLPVDSPLGLANAGLRASSGFTLTAAQTATLLKQAPAAYRTQVNDLLLTALARMLADVTGQSQVRIDVEGHGREADAGAPDISRTVGWFTTMYPVVLEVSGDVGQALKRVKETLRAVPRRGVGHGPLLAGQALASSPVLFNYLGQFDGSFGDAQGWQPASESAGAALDAGAALWHELAVDGQVYQGQLTMTLTYSRARLSEGRARDWADRYRQALLELIEHCASGARGATPSDFPLLVLTQPQLDGLPLTWPRVEDLYGVSPMQAGMMFHAKVEAEAGLYVTQLQVDLRDLDPARLRAAWAAALGRHEALRSGFAEAPGGASLQWVARDVDLPWRELDWRGQPDTASALEALAREERLLPFDLAAPPLMRWVLARTGDTEYRLLWTSHHLLLDGWSTSRLLGEVLRAYQGETVAAPAARYRDYLAWLSRLDTADARTWWTADLARLEEPSLLATAAPTTDDAGHGEISCRLNAADSAQLTACARQQRVTPNTLVQAAWARVLQSELGQSTVAFGATSSGRPAELPGAETLLGLFINTIPVVVPAAPALTVGDWLRAVQARGVAALDHQHTPLYDIQRWAGQGGRALFDTLVVFENYPIDAALREVKPGGLEIGQVHNSDPTHYPLTLEAALREDAGTPVLSLRYVYRRDCLTDSRVQSLADTFKRVLTAMLADPNRLVADLDVLALPDRQALVSQGDGGAARLVLSVPERLAGQAAATPDAPALVMGAVRLSYAELDARTNQLAHALRAVGAGAETRVGVLMTRSVEMVVALLGVMKAGAAYVPMDPELPAERLSYLLEDSQAELLLTQSTWLETLPVDTLPAWALDQIDLSAHPSTPIGHVPHPEQAAYVIYTSGSTGKPKGAVNRHGALAQRLDWMQQAYPIDAADTVLQKTPFGFDVSVWEFFWPLMVGAQLAVAEPGEHRDPQALAARIAAHGVTTLHFVPSMLSAFLAGGVDQARLPTLRRIVCSGEALPGDLRDRCFAALPDVALNNLYGPTEAAIDVTFHDCVVNETGAVPIGAPITGTQVYVLDADLNLAPPGVAGELYLGGAGLARGYLSRPGMTAERFVANPFGAGRLYRTGDRVRWTESGELDYLGRLDFQVKIRGLRIELGEIESRLLAQAGVREAVVVAANGPGGGQRLVAYVAPQVDSAALRTALARELPEYMVPSQIIPLEALPLSANGKIDRKALPAPVFDDQTSATPPQGPLETAIAGIWADVLGCTSVGREANFFELGGDSILSLQIVARLRQQGWGVNPRDLFEHQTVARLAVMAKPLLEAAEVPQEDVPHGKLSDYLDDDGLARCGIDAAALEDVYPVSPVQEGMVFHSLESPGTGLYVNQLSVPVGHIDVARFAQAWRVLVARHPILRTGILWQGGLSRPLQLVYRNVDAVVPVFDWRGQNTDDARIAAYAQAELTRDFDYARAPLARVSLLRLEDDRYQLVWTQHHALMDGWSESRLMGEWLRAYAGQELPATGPGYGAYVRWLARQDAARGEAWWRKLLGGLDGPTLLASAGKPTGQTGYAKRYTRLDAAATGRLAAFAQRERVTVNTLVQAAWALLLQRYTRKDTVAFGSTVAGRPPSLPGVERIMGLFINTIPVPVTRQPEQSVGEYLRGLQALNLDLREQEHTPLADIQRWAGSAGRSLFDSIIVFENHPVDAVLRGDERYGLDFGDAERQGLTGYAMDLQVMWGDTLQIEYCYGCDAFDAGFVETLRGHMEHTLSAMAEDAARRVGDLPWITPEQRAEVWAWGGHRTGAWPRQPQQTVHARIAAHARRRPDAPAIIMGTRCLDYGTLDAAANRLAHRLMGQGVGPETRVGVLMERTPEVFVALLAVLKAGGCYVPMDPAYPAERLAFMMADSGMALLLSQQRLLGRDSVAAALPAGLRVLALDGLGDGTPDATAPDAPAPDHDPAVPLSSDNLAYLIYTSGSTGRPKGVCVTHGPLSMHCAATAEIYGMDADWRELIFMSLSFDGAHERWLTSLITGASLVLRDDELWTAEQTLGVLGRHQVTHAAFPPAYLGQLAEGAGTEVPPVKLYVYGGEAMPRATYDKVRHALRPQWLINGYGPTETVVTPMIWKSRGDESFTCAYAPIGRVVGERSLYVLDADLQAVPVGHVGELYIGGYGLARGYLGRPDLTADRFVADPFGTPGSRLYRSGDLVRWMPDGNIEYVGRADHQVKLRGFRIELGEIEARIRECPGVLDAVITLHQGSTGAQLVAYVVPLPGVGTQDLARHVRDYAAAHLPEHMVPGQVELLPELPVLPSGKLDRSRLPEPRTATVAQADHVAPRTPREARLAEIWAQVLRVDSVGITDNFFELGGDSILSLQLVSKVRQAGLGLSFKLRDLMRHQTIDALLAHLDETGGTAPAAIPAPSAAPAPAPVPCTPIQAWFFESDIPSPHHYNQSVLLTPRAELNPALLRAAAQAVQAHHPALRTRFSRTAGGGWLQVADALGAPVAPLDIADAADADTLRQLCTQVQRSLSFDGGPIWRLALFRLPDGQQRLLAAVHHLVVDGYSWRVLLEDLQTAYRQLSLGQTVALPAASAPFADWARHVDQTATAAAIEGQADYWAAQVADACDIPRDHPDVDTPRSEDVQGIDIGLNADDTRALLRAAQGVYDAAIDDLLLTALGRCLSDWAGGSVLVDMEGHGREGDAADIDLSRSVGWFTTVYPVRLSGAGLPLRQALADTRQALRTVPEKGVGFGMLKYLGTAAQQARMRQGAARVTFNYMGQFDQAFDADALYAPADEHGGAEKDAAAPLANWLEVVGRVYGGELSFSWRFSRRMYQPATIERLATSFRSELLALLNADATTPPAPPRSTANAL
ncbi:amino acid adenylation domain-containing protein [Achromobacter pestifer]